ncbi:Zn(II)2Cys6 transcription factor, partial [Candidatus Bathyarchaeota archaeon]|nr:Zn(II)2Cys6 transcription factor [Candidatus Bathyarchaeota archaeon]
MTCRRRKTRCFGERPVCSTCTKNNHTCQGYSDEAEKKYGEEPETADGGALRRTQSHEDDSDDEHERRHSKSKLDAARSPAGGKPVRFDTDDSFRNPTPYPSVKTESRRNSHQQREAGLTESPAFTQRRDSTAWSRQDRYPDLRRVSCFRYFGPTAIVPGFKQVVSVQSRRRSNTAASFSEASPAPALGPPGVDFHNRGDNHALSTEELPTYDINDPGPVPPLILHLVQTFFLHLGCNYPFLRQDRFYALVTERRAEPILVDAVCALAARFSDSPVFLQNDGPATAAEHGQFYAQRAKAATVDTFPCPTVGAVQAYLLMAYEGFGANQDSALWMYLGLA